MQDFRRLTVWQRAHGLVLDVYVATRGFPVAERFALQAQLRRAASAIPTNLAEGCGCASDREFRRFVRIALASASEVEYQLLLARDLGFIPESRHRALGGSVVQVKRMLTRLAQTLDGACPPGRAPSRVPRPTADS